MDIQRRVNGHCLMITNTFVCTKSIQMESNWRTGAHSEGLVGGGGGAKTDDNGKERETVMPSHISQKHTHSF